MKYYYFKVSLQEKIDALRVLGAEVYPVPAVPFDDPNNYNHQVNEMIKLHVYIITGIIAFDNRSSLMT